MRALFLLFCAMVAQAATPVCSSGTWSGTTCTGAVRPVTYTVSGTTAADADFQDVVEDAQCGDTIEVDNASTFTAGTQNIITLPNPGGSCGYVTITTTQAAKLPNPGTRITKAYSPLLPKFVLTSSTGPWFAIPPAGAPEYTAITYAPGVASNNWRFVGLQFEVSAAYTSAEIASRGFISVGVGGITVPTSSTNHIVSASVSGGIASVTTHAAHGWIVGDTVKARTSKHEDKAIEGVYVIATRPTTTTLTFETDAPDDDYNEVGSTGTIAGVGPFTSSTLSLSSPAGDAFLPTGIVVDRVVMTNKTWTAYLKRLIYTDGGGVEIKNSFLEGSQVTGSDGQSIGGTRGGATIISNNYVGPATENILWGGDRNTPGDPKSVDIRYNYFPLVPERYWTLRWGFLDEEGPGKNGLVFAGRMVRSSAGTGNYYMAQNTGYISGCSAAGCSGSVEPNWTVDCPSSGNVCPIDGQVYWKNTGGVGNWVIKNRYENKGVDGGLFEFNVLDGHVPENNQYAAVNIKSEQQTLYPFFNNNCVPTLTGKVTTNGTAVTWAEGDFPYGFRVDDGGVDGDAITINGVVYTIATMDSATQLTLTGSAGVQASPVDMSYGQTVFAPCMADYNRNFIFRNNYIRDVVRPFSLTIGGNGRFAFVEGLQVKNNLSTVRASYWTEEDGTPYGVTASQWKQLFGLGQFTPGAQIEHNTTIALDASTNYSQIWSSQNPVPTSDAVIRNNYFDGQMTVETWYGEMSGGSTFHNGSALVRELCGVAATECPKAQWDGNVLAGQNLHLTTLSTTAGPTTGLQLWPGTTYNLRPSTSSAGTPDRDAFFQDYTNGRYRVKLGSAYRHASVEGKDIGVDMSKIPRINNLNVTASDRMVLFQWSHPAGLPQELKDTPCVIEVHTSPDFHTIAAYPNFDGVASGYAGELSDIATYYRQDADDHDKWVRYGNSRMLVVGHSVPLVASTRYFYRLQCAGDTRTGEFTTLGTLEGTTTLRASSDGAATMTWGYEYSRDTDEITDEQAGSCADDRCIATPDKGKVAYYRIGSGKVRPTMVQ